MAGKVVTILFDEDTYKRLAALKRYNVAPNRLVNVAVEACIDTFEKEIPSKRMFKLNGVEVIP